MDRELVETYAEGGGKLALAIRGLARDDLLAIPQPDDGVGKWSIQQVVLHLADADVIWSARMKCIIAEDNPTIIPFDQDRFVAALFYQEQDAHDAAQLFDMNRKQFGKVLSKLPDAAFSRTGRHIERGTITLEQSLRFMIEHLEHHLTFIHKKRARMGKEMW